MTICIPTAQGVPGLNGPPNWLTATPVSPVHTELDDPRWRGAARLGFPFPAGGGTSEAVTFRALYHTVGTNTSLYLSWRINFDPSLDNDDDFLVIGFRPSSGVGATNALAIQVVPYHTTAADKTAEVAHSFQALTNTGAGWGPAGTEPTWINTNTRVWLKRDPGGVGGAWAVQMRVPIQPGAVSLTDNSGLNLTNSFGLWFFVRMKTPGSTARYEWPVFAPVTPVGDILAGNYPTNLALWDLAHLRAGAADPVCPADGGIDIQYLDVGTTNSPSSRIRKLVNNTFYARPRNYRPIVLANTIPIGGIAARFRIANWGSIADASAPWVDVPGGSNPPVPSTDTIAALTAGAAPPATNPIHFDWNPSVNPLPGGPAAENHQCMLVELSGPGLTFINDSIYRNMDFDSASMISRTADINIMGLKSFSPQPRDVYLALEKINMPARTPDGYNEGRFLESSINRLMEQGGELADKLKEVQARLAEADDYGSSAKLKSLLGELRQSLAKLTSGNPKEEQEELDQLLVALRQWLPIVKENKESARQLAALFDALSDWLLASDLDAADKLVTFIAQFDQWLSGLSADPVSAEFATAVAPALRTWLYTLKNGGGLAEWFERLQGWLSSGQPTESLPGMLDTLYKLLASLPENEENGDKENLRTAVGTFSDEAVEWVKGHERLNMFVNFLSEVGLASSELDQLFPTFRVYVYHDTGERVIENGSSTPVLSAQSSFGLYAYHEDALEGWQTSIQGATRIAENFYVLKVPNDSMTKITTLIQAVEPDDKRLPEDPIQPIDPDQPPDRIEPPDPTVNRGCLARILAIFGIRW